MRPAMVVHGGAGAWEPGSPRLLAAIEACSAAASAGMAVLATGSALDAVEAAVRALEDAPMLDAGHGSLLNADGDIEMDALIMDGATLEVGAVAAVRLVRNPVSLARQVMRTKHALLVGAGAEAFADSIGFPRCSFEDLATRETRAIHDKLRASPVSDTVGAVGIDARGNVAVATSTGGTPEKLPGRVGDTPLAGCGAYADNASAAVAATGWGEAFMRTVLSKRVADAVGRGLTPQAACDEALAYLRERLNGNGGLIALDPAGAIGIARTTAAMPWAHATADSMQSGS